MPQTITPISAFTTPVTAPAPTDPADELEVVALAQQLANRTQFLRDIVTDSGIVLPSSQLGSHYFGPASLVPNQGVTTTRAEGSLLVASDAGLVFCDLSRALPRSASIVRLRALVDPGAARALGQRMSVALVSHVFGGSFAAPTAPVVSSVGSQADDGATTLQWITLDLTGAPVAVSTAAAWTARIAAGIDASANNDRIYGVEVEFTYTTIRRD
jgi:hypothetical protein